MVIMVELTKNCVQFASVTMTVIIIIMIMMVKSVSL